MASLLEGKIKDLVFWGFNGRLLSGTLRRATPATQDAFGDPVPGTPLTYPFQGIRDTFSAVYAAQASIPVTDVRILIIAGSITTAPRQGDEVFISGAWHKVRAVLEIDPAGATYTLQAYQVPG